MSKIRFADTTLRDGHLSLWASAMTTQMMLPVLEQMDRAGFAAMEVTGTGFFKKCIRELKDDPWERVRQAARHVTRTPLRSIRSRCIPSFQLSSQAMADLWVERLAANGISELRIMDQSNTVAELQRMVTGARKAGHKVILQIVFSISPKHTDEYFAERVRAAAAMEVVEICLKDPGGLLTPDRIRTLVPVFLANAGGIPVSIHTHCNTGLGPLACLEAVRHGICMVDTAIPPLANGSSNPSVLQMARNVRAIGHTPEIDVEALKPVCEHFRAVARQAGLPEGTPLEYDEFHYQHQVPGGMISNLKHQLAQVGLAGRLDQVLEEAARVRADFGYPIMVTPYSQFVGVQAAINVMTGERYKEVTDEVIHYALGNWGEEEQDGIDPDVRDRILARPRADELAAAEIPQLSVAEVRRKLDAGSISDDELLLWYLAGREDVKSLRAMSQNGPSPEEGLSVRQGLPDLIAGLGRVRRFNQVFIQKDDFSLRMGRRKQA